MKSAFATLKSVGLVTLSAVALSVAPWLAKSAQATATASSEETQTAEAPVAETPASSEISAEAAQESAETSPQGAAGSDSSDADGESDEWIMDEEKGQRYKIGRVPKIEGTYIWRGENHVRLPGGLSRVEVVKHDERWFWIKIWEPKTLPIREPSAPPEISQEEIDRVLASYTSDAGTADRVQLQPFDRGLPKTGQWRQGFDIADMNGDGHLDIVFGPSRKGRPLPNIFLGDSQGSWRLWREARYPKMPYDYGDAAAADFNGDGHQDVAFGFHLRGMLALISDGQGGFEPWTQGLELSDPRDGSDATAFSSRAIEDIDWNQDGRVDLLALGEGPKGMTFGPGKASGSMINTSRAFVLFVNQGDGTWSREPVDQSSRDFGDDFTFGDFDRDGRTDLAIASRRRGNRAILRTSATGEDGLLGAEQLTALRKNASLTSVAAADLDGDGFEEFLLGFINRELDVWRSGIDLYFKDSAGEWQRRNLATEESRAGVWDMTVGEIDGDGALDLVGLTGEGEAWVFLGDGQGWFVRETSPELPKRVKGCVGAEVRLVDLDRDGRDEIVASFAGEPTGPIGLPGVISFPGCPGQGRINAWRVVPAGEAASVDSATPAP